MKKVIVIGMLIAIGILNIDVKEAISLQTEQGELCGCMVDERPPSFELCEGINLGNTIVITVSTCN